MLSLYPYVRKTTPLLLVGGALMLTTSCATKPANKVNFSPYQPYPPITQPIPPVYPVPPIPPTPAPPGGSGGGSWRGPITGGIHIPGPCEGGSCVNILD